MAQVYTADSFMMSFDKPTPVSHGESSASPDRRKLGTQEVRKTLSTLLDGKATSARVRALLLPIFMAWGCASGVQMSPRTIPDHYDAHAQGSDVFELTENGVERVWTLQEAVGYLEGRLGRSEVRRMLFVGESEHQVEIRRARAEQERQGPRTEVIGADEFSIAPGMMERLLDEGYPRSWTRRSAVEDLTLTRTSRPMHPEYGIPGNAGGHCVRGPGNSASQIVVARSVFYQNVGPDGGALTQTISHELGHAEDWYSAAHASFSQRVRWLFWAVRRVESDRGLDSYVRQIHSSTAENQLRNRAVEYFATIHERVMNLEEAAARHAPPEHFESEVIRLLAGALEITHAEATEVYAIVKEMTVVTDPEFDRRSGALARWNFAQEASRQALPTHMTETLFAQLPDRELASDLVREVQTGALHRPTDAIRIIDEYFGTRHEPTVRLDANTLNTVRRWQAHQEQALDRLAHPLSEADARTFQIWTRVLAELGSVSRSLLTQDAHLAHHHSTSNEDTWQTTYSTLALNYWVRLQMRLAAHPLSPEARLVFRRAMDIVYGRGAEIAADEQRALQTVVQAVSTQRHLPYADTAL